MRKELEKNYNPEDIEGRLYRKWVDNGYFHAEVDRSRKPFTIVMPPPNITGQLHMGHALDNTMQDILIRMKRMQGYNALWQPGTDHAAIATEVRIIASLKEQGIDKNDLGREGFLKKAWEWREEYGGRIVNQLKRMGSSADWDRERFTMDEGNNKAVNTVFKKLYDKGWIYKGSRIVNWCPVCETTISDAEVEHVEQNGNFWHINYPVVGEEGRFVEIATTRPETLLGDTAVAVNPEDERYADIVGKTLLLPLVNREIPVIADAYVDKEFGTGCVKITPGHDPNDFEVGKRHNLEEINIMNDDATINCPDTRYHGMDRYEARKAVLEDLEAQGLLVKTVPHTHMVGTHDRCGTTVEPLIKPQWFVKMNDMALRARKVVETGEVKLVPERMNKIYYNWIDNIRDWCISRQLWWGHRIPAWYCQDCGETIVEMDEPCECPKCKSKNLKRDPDTLDTWFSSALWPFSTVGWPDTESEDFKYFFPTDVLVTGYDIIFFWVIRMIFSSLEQTDKIPFHTVLFHGLVRDEQGRKMSKSLGNGVDPLEIIDKYGADALRFMLITGNAPGNDMRFIWDRLDASRNFANKIWNASRFIMMNMPDADEEGGQAALDAVNAITLDDLTMADKWIVAKANQLVRDVTDNMEKFELGIAADKIHGFLWDEFCDWYIEMVKPRLWDENDTTKAAALWTLREVLSIGLKLLHPYMPFVTEEIYCTLTGRESIMIDPWPVAEDARDFDVEAKNVDIIKDAVRAIRTVRTDMNVPPSRKAAVYVVSDKEDIRSVFEESSSFFAALGYASDVKVQADKTGIQEDAVSAVIHNAVIYIPFAELVDIEKELERLNKEKARLEGEIKRGEGMLGNPNFVNKAPEEKVNAEKEKLAKYKETYAQVCERIGNLK
ncbi:valyl-tRNA synthetase [Lachnospiraceae bacterium]|nr:valyl-tRNA synthetase [Lachnospiraceae bacterium]